MSLDSDPLMYVTSMDAIVGHWFTTYADSRATLEAQGGYLLPYREQFFITSREGIRELGLDPDDPDWARIGWDWVQPLDSKAWERLRDRRAAAERFGALAHGRGKATAIRKRGS